MSTNFMNIVQGWEANSSLPNNNYFKSVVTATSERLNELNQSIREASRQLQDILQDKQTKYSDLEGQADSLRQTQTQHTLKETAKEKDKYEKELHSTRSELAKKSEELTAKAQEVDDLARAENEKLTMLHRELHHLRELGERKDLELQRQKTEYQRLRVSKDELAKTLIEVQEKERKQQSEKDVLLINIENLTRTERRHTQMLHMIQSDFETWDSEYNNVSRAYRELSTHFSRTLQSNQRQRQSIAQLGLDLKDNEETRKGLTRQNSERSLQVQELQKKQTEYQEQISAKDSDIRSKELEYERKLQKMSAELASKHRRAQSQEFLLQSKEDEVRRHLDNVQEIEYELSQLSQEKAEMSLVLGDTNSYVQELEATIEEKTNALEGADRVHQLDLVAIEETLNFALCEHIAEVHRLNAVIASDREETKTAFQGIVSVGTELEERLAFQKECRREAEEDATNFRREARTSRLLLRDQEEAHEALEKKYEGKVIELRERDKRYDEDMTQLRSAHQQELTRLQSHQWHTIDDMQKRCAEHESAHKECRDTFSRKEAELLALIRSQAETIEKLKAQYSHETETIDDSDEEPQNPRKRGRGGSIELGSSMALGMQKRRRMDHQGNALISDSQEDERIFGRPRSVSSEIPIAHHEVERDRPPLDGETLRDNANRLWGMFVLAWDYSHEEEEVIRGYLGAVIKSRKELSAAVRDIDVYCVGGLITEPPYPRPCLMAKLFNKNAGKGGQNMTSRQCKYCNKKGRICLWAKHVPGVATGFGPRINGQISAGNEGRKYDPTQQPWLVELGGNEVRWVLKKRKMAADEPADIPWEVGGTFV